MSYRKRTLKEVQESNGQGDWAFSNAVARGDIVYQYEIPTEMLIEEMTRLGGRDDPQSLMRFYQIKEIIENRQGLSLVKKPIPGLIRS